MIFLRKGLTLPIELKISKKMIDNNKTSSIEEKQYKAPEVRVFFLSAQDVLCNSPMYEEDYGDGGFNVL